MRRIVIAALLIGALSGCNVKKHSQQKVEAYQRWSQARAGVVTSLAVEYLKAGQLEKARTRATEALTMAPDHVPAMVVLAKVLIEDGAYARAVEELRIAEVQAAEDPEVAYLLGVALEKRGDHAEALKCYQKARALDEENSHYVTASAEVLVSMGKPQAGLELLKARLERDDSDRAMLALAGELAMLVGEPAEAAEFFQRCLDGDPTDFGTREELAKAHFFAGNYTGALAVLEKLAAHPRYRGKAAWVRIMIGNSYLALKRPRKARDAYRVATVIEPEEPHAWASLAKAAMTLGDLNGTILAARRALDVGGECLEATTLLGYALLRQGQAAEAKKVLTGVVGKHPNDPTLLCMLGRCCEALGQNDQAVAYYASVLRSHPDHPLARALAGRRKDTATK
jgi:Tfp pilus assembly protein PilF